MPTGSDGTRRLQRLAASAYVGHWAKSTGSGHGGMTTSGESGLRIAASALCCSATQAGLTRSGPVVRLRCLTSSTCFPATAHGPGFGRHWDCGVIARHQARDRAGPRAASDHRDGRRSRLRLALTDLAGVAAGACRSRPQSGPTPRRASDGGLAGEGLTFTYRDTTQPQCDTFYLSLSLSQPSRSRRVTVSQVLSAASALCFCPRPVPSAQQLSLF